ncbi:MAG TPA: DPP IV N-terminal domain-containing protein, partial [Isosphaeraceae bacterium]
MPTRRMSPARLTSALLVAASIAALPSVAPAQDRLKTMPGYDRFQEMSKKATGAFKTGQLSVTWKEGGKAFEYRKDGKPYRFDIAEGKAREAAPTGDEAPPTGRRGRGGGGVERGRQLASALSPDGSLKAFCRDRNLWIGDAKGLIEVAVTTDGSVKDRVKNGTASWVYGEELDQNTAMWWSPDGKKLAYYRFDESKVPDYFLSLDQTKFQDRLDVEAYPKVGAPNPVADLFVYDLAAKKTVRINVRDGRPF